MRTSDWSKLNHLQIGRYAEYVVKMEFTLQAFQVYSSEVDDRGIDFVMRRDGGPYYEVQVKSLRNKGYIFLEKDKCQLAANRLVAVVLFRQDEPPALYLVPTLAWTTPDKLLVSRDYIGKKSKPEWGLDLSLKNLPLMERFTFDRTLQTL